MPDGTIEITTVRDRRRRWSTAEKSRIVAETLKPGARVTDVAARHNVSACLIYEWRRQMGNGRPGLTTRADFVPVRVRPSGDEATSPFPPRQGAAMRPGTAPIEVTMPDGSRIGIKRDASPAILRAVIAALRG